MSYSKTTPNVLSFWGSHQISWPWLPSAGAISRRNKPTFWTYTEVLNLRHTGICLLRAATHRLELGLIDFETPQANMKYWLSRWWKSLVPRDTRILVPKQAAKTTNKKKTISTENDGAPQIRWRCRCSDGTRRFTTGTKRSDIGDFLHRRCGAKTSSLPFLWCLFQGGAHHWLLDDLSWCDTSAGPKIYKRSMTWKQKHEKKHINLFIYSEYRESAGKTPEFAISASRSSESALPQNSATAQSEIELFDNQFFGIDAKEVWMPNMS